MSIQVKNVSKVYKIRRRTQGLSGYVRGLFHSEYDRKQALSGISFEIDSGEIVGYIGPNGSGKSTTIKLLCGILTPDAGQIQVAGRPVDIRDTAYKKLIGVVFGQRSNLWNDLPSIDTFRLFQNIYELSDQEFQEHYDFINSFLDLTGLQEIPVRKLSLGQKMKCEIAAAMLHFPEVVFLDEPTIGLDIDTRRNVIALMREYNRRFHKTIIITSHNLYDIEELCSRVIVIDHGAIVAQGQLESIKEQYVRYRLVSVKFAGESARQLGEEHIRKHFNDQVQTSTENGRLICRIAVRDKDVLNELMHYIMEQDTVENFEVFQESMESVVRNILG